jgi:23S rRNA (cytosine1962-C5)-methyltransferase
MGETVVVTAHDGSFLARAAYCPSSQIRARVWSFDEADEVDQAFIERRIEQAIARRVEAREGSTGVRLVHGESDGAAGAVADQYDDVAVVQLLSAGAERWRDLWGPALARAAGVRAVYERSDVEVRALEGLAPRVGPLVGEAPGTVSIVEDGINYEVDVVAGQKTGFFLDQRDNRALAARRSPRRRRAERLLLHRRLHARGAEGRRATRAIRSTLPRRRSRCARRNLALNDMDAARADWLAADVFAQLRKYRDQGASFDLIVLDPPKFAPTEKHVPNAARALQGHQPVGAEAARPGRQPPTFSCSGAVSARPLRQDRRRGRGRRQGRMPG